MTQNELLEKAAAEAVRSAADRLGVDPLRLARFLGEGRIAQIVGALGHQEALATERERLAALTRDYLDFLEEEMRLCREELKAMGGGGPAE